MDVIHNTQQLSPSQVGSLGETLACEYLRSRGYEIIDRNWRCSRGEIDIVAHFSDTLVAVEVKSRRGAGYGAPLEAIGYRKARRLRLLLGLWTRESGRSFRALRIDGIGVTFREGAQPKLEHVEGIV